MTGHQNDVSNWQREFVNRRRNWGAVCYGLTIGGLLVLMMASDNQADRAAKYPPLNSNASVSTVGLSARSVQTPYLSDDSLPSDDVINLKSYTTLTSHIDSTFAKIGRCDGDYVCHDIKLVSAEGPLQAVASTGTGKPAFDRQCAEKDLKVMTLVDELGASGEIGSDKLGEAGLMLVTARATCAEGGVSQALVMYDDILSETLILAKIR